MKTQTNPKAIYTKFKKPLNLTPKEEPEALKIDKEKKDKQILFRESKSYKKELASLAHKKEMSMQVYIVTALEFYKQNG